MRDQPSRVLAIDTSLERVSVAIIDDAGKPLASQSAPVRPGKAEAVVSLLTSLSADAENFFSDLRRVAVVIGPGSFTGVRIGVSAARALGVAFDFPIVGVSTFQAFAAPFLERGAAVAVILEARDAHVFFQLFDSSGRSRFPPALLLASAAIQSLVAEDTAILTGNLQEEAQEEFMKSALACGTRIEAFHMRASADIYDVARVGARLDPTSSPPEPIYLHAPQPKNATMRRK